MSFQGSAGDLFQENEAYQHAGILLYDSVAGSRQATRSILFNLGFREINMVADLATFEEELDSDHYDLVIADLTDQISEISNLVSRVRKSELGGNPFQVVVLTSFELDTAGLMQALNSGADDLLIRPLSTGMIQKRVKSLVESRKDFVVTSEYIGPDRRADPDRPNSADLVKVPNSLKDRIVEGPRSAHKTAEKIAEMRDKVAEDHLHSLAVRLGVEAHCFTNAEVGSAKAITSRDSLEKLAVDISNRIGPTRDQASSMVKMLTNVLAGTQKVHPDRQAELIHQLAMGVGVALSADGDEDAMAAEIEATVDKVNNRMGWTETEAKKSSSAA